MDKSKAPESQPATRRITTTFTPNAPLDVSEAEYVDLRRQGLIVEPRADDAKTPVNITTEQEGSAS